MFWQEDDDKTEEYQTPDNVFDLSFSIQCKQLPLDHAWLLQEAIAQHLPWIKEQPQSGIHQIHVAESGNGWARPDDSQNECLTPSRRTRLILRIPQSHLAQAKSLTGQTLDLDGNSLKVGTSKEKQLLKASVIFARHINSTKDESEPEFLQRMANEIFALAAFKVKKMMCGKSHTLHTPDNQLFTRHVMIADLDNDTSIKLQESGLGEFRSLGCGLFLPHKSIQTLNPVK